MDLWIILILALEEIAYAFDTILLSNANFVTKMHHHERHQEWCILFFFSLTENSEEAPAISPRILAKQLNIGNPATLEKRIQKELEEQGLVLLLSFLL